jgi:hypothetical protein
VISTSNIFAAVGINISHCCLFTYTDLETDSWEPLKLISEKGCCSCFKLFGNIFTMDVRITMNVQIRAQEGPERVARFVKFSQVTTVANIESSLSDQCLARITYFLYYVSPVEYYVSFC